MITPGQTDALVVAVGESVAAARDCLMADPTPTPFIVAAHACLRSAMASITALAMASEGLVGDSEDEDGVEEDGEGPATDDPSTCAHPKSWDLLGQIMCESCGATRISLDPEAWDVV